MSNLSGSGQSSSNNPNDDHEETNGNASSTTNKTFLTSNCRITSPLLIKRQQTLETKIANNQAYDEIHDIQPKHSSMKKNDQRSPTDNSHELMQSNYYDPNRFDLQSTRKCSERGVIAISVEDYKKTIAGSLTVKTRPRSPPFGETSESIQEGVAQSAGILLETKKKSTKTKKHEQAVLDYFPKDEQKDRSRTSSSSSSDDSSSNESSKGKSDDYPNIPYKTLSNKEDDEDECEDEEDEEQEQEPEQVQRPANESTTLLNKNSSQTYGTQTTSRPLPPPSSSSTTTTTTERSKSLATNGYNSQGSSINTKSSSDNSGSIRTNSGSDNDEESEEEHYNNSTVENNNSIPMSVYSLSNDSTRKNPMNKINDQHDIYRNASNGKAKIDDEQHLQVPRFKQPPSDDPNENLNKNTPTNFAYESSMNNAQKQSSSQQNRTTTERPTATATRSSTSRTGKKRKQLQQEVIRTEFIPGHRGDLDVDELVMFIDGKAKGNHSLSDPNGSNKTATRKKSRKPTKTLSATDDQQDETKDHLSETNENLSQPNEINGTTSNSSETSVRRDWFEQTRQELLNDDEDDEVEPLSSTTKLTNQLNSVTLSEPFVTVKNRRRSMKERRIETTPTSYVNTAATQPTRFPLNNDKRRFVSTTENETKRLSSRNSLPNMKSNLPTGQNVVTSTATAVASATPPLPPPPQTVAAAAAVTTTTTTTTNPPVDSLIEKPQSSPRLSSQSSTSSLSSLLKRTSKAPAVVFLNKSANIELNDVSFGFDIDPISSDFSITNQTRRETDETNDSHSSTQNESNQQENSLAEQIPTEHSTTPTIVTAPPIAPQRNTRDPQFYSGSDIRPHHRPYHPTQTIPTTPYIDPLLLLQYNQQRFPNYPSPLTYMNILRAPYLHSQPQYVFLPSSYPPVIPNESETDVKTTDETTTSPPITSNRTSNESIPEASLTYSSVPNESTTMFYPSTGNVQGNVPPPPPLSSIYPHTSAMFYPRLTQNPPTIFPPPTAYFQPISSPSLYVETKLDERAIEQDNHSYENSRQTYHSKDQLPSTSSDIMSNALQLVYSQQRRNAQTDRFNLDDLTAYLALKWTETVDHYEQGDKRIILVDQHE